MSFWTCFSKCIDGVNIITVYIPVAVITVFRQVKNSLLHAVIEETQPMHKHKLAMVTKVPCDRYGSQKNINTEQLPYTTEVVLI